MASLEQDRADRARTETSSGAPRPWTTARSIGENFATSLLLQAGGVVTGIVLARSLGATNRGALAAGILWPAVFATIATLGLQEAVTFHIAREPSATGRVIGSGLVLVLIQSLVFTALCAAALPLVLANRSAATLTAGFVYLVFIPMNAVGILMVGILNGGFHQRAFNAVRLSVSVTVLLAQVILLVLGALTVTTMVIGYATSSVICAVFACVLVGRTRPGRLGVDRAMVRSLFAYGIRSHASNTSSVLNQRLDQMIISIFLPARQLGLYVVATTLTSLTGTVGLTVAFVALPEVARLPPGPERARLARQLISLTLAVSALAAIPVVIAAPFFIKLFFGASFAAAADVTRILALAVVWFSTSRAIEAVLRAVGRPLDAGIAEFIALGVTMVSLAVLIPLAGILGAGLASLLAYGVAVYWMTRRAAVALDTSWYRLLAPDRRTVRLLIDLLTRLRARSRS